jgi:C4-dicarboxylate transporter DctM subunit
MEGTLIPLISISAAVLFAFGMPILLVIGHWVLWTSVVTDFNLSNISMTLIEGINVFGLLALPLFVLTGDVINGAGIAKRLTDFAYSLLGWIRGGLGMSALGACGMFAAISGSNAATTATIGSIMHKEMKEGNYDECFSAATVAAGGVVGIIIPPSILLVVYGYLLHLPVGDLFMAGLIPGALLILGMQITCMFMAWRNGWGVINRFRPVEALRNGARAYLGFVAIGIVLWGIYGGAFSPTESAAVTVMFGIVAGTLITRELSLRALPKILLASGRITGMIVPLVAMSIVMQQLLSILGAPQAISSFVTSIGDGYWSVLIICMAMILIAGSLLESVPVTIILAPVLAPIAQNLGVDPIHFAIVFVVGTAIGFITPPFGLNLFVASSVTGISFMRILPSMVPYLAMLMMVWIVIMLWPELSTYLPAISGAG